MTWCKIAMNDHAGGLPPAAETEAGKRVPHNPVGALDDAFIQKHTYQTKKGTWCWTEEARNLFQHMPKEARHNPSPQNEMAMKAMSDDEMVAIVLSTVQGYLSEEFSTRPQPATMGQIGNLLTCLESRLYDRKDLDLVHLKNVLLISDRMLPIEIANKLGLTLTFAETSTAKSTGRKEYSSTTGSSSSARIQSTTVRKSGNSSNRTSNRARNASIGPVEIKEYQVEADSKLAPTARTQLLAKNANVRESQIPQFGLHRSLVEAAAVPVDESSLTDNEDTWSTTAMDGSSPKSRQLVNRHLIAAVSAQQAEIIERTLVRQSLATNQTEEVASGKKQARAYPTSESPSLNQEEEYQINRCIGMLKDVMHQKKVRLLEAERMMLDLIVDKDRETENATGSADSTILHDAVRRLRESGVE